MMAGFPAVHIRGHGGLSGVATDVRLKEEIGCPFPETDERR